MVGCQYYADANGSGGCPPSLTTSVATPMNSLNSGCGLLGLDLNSGWNWVPSMNLERVYSMISISLPSGEIPVGQRSTASNRSR